LIGFDNEYYLLQTELGDLRVSADKVRCEGGGCPVFEEILPDVSIAGSDTITDGLMPLLLAGFATDINADASTETTQNQNEFAATLVGEEGFGDKIGTYLVQSGTSEDAFSKLMDRSIQVGMSSRRILPDEARALKDAGAGNMVDPSGANSVFETGIFGEEEVQLASAFAAEDNVEAALYVNDNPGAIAYVGYAFKRGQKPLSLVSSCGIGTTPDAFSVKTEEYALFRRLYMYNRADTDSQLTQDFVNFATSDAASQVILQSGFIDLAIEQVPLGATSSRALRAKTQANDPFEVLLSNQMIEMLDENDRLSSTFRFRTGLRCLRTVLAKSAMR